MTCLPARAARQAAGLTLADAARRARVTEGHLAQCERHNRFCYLLAQKLAAAYLCPLTVFLPKREDRPPNPPRRQNTPGKGSPGKPQGERRKQQQPMKRRPDVDTTTPGPIPEGLASPAILSRPTQARKPRRHAEHEAHDPRAARAR